MKTSSFDSCTLILAVEQLNPKPNDINYVLLFTLWTVQCCNDTTIHFHVKCLTNFWCTFRMWIVFKNLCWCSQKFVDVDECFHSLRFCFYFIDVIHVIAMYKRHLLILSGLLLECFFFPFLLFLLTQSIGYESSIHAHIRLTASHNFPIPWNRTRCIALTIWWTWYQRSVLASYYISKYLCVCIRVRSCSLNTRWAEKNMRWH